MPLSILLFFKRRSDFSPEQLGFLTYGRGVDTTRMRTRFGFTPRYTTEEALHAYLVDSGAEPLVTRAALERKTAKIQVFGLPQ